MLKQNAIKQLLDLKFILNQVEDSDYSKALTVLESGTLGKHVRHILEFYQCMFVTNNTDIICYDDRKRNLLLEENIRYATDYIDELVDLISMIEINKSLLLKSKYDSAEIIMESSLYRELTYNIEHTVHHLAIIRIAVTTELKYITINANFGYADSTIKYLETQKLSA